MSKKQVGNYILDRRIGKGSYATVWKGRVEGKVPEDTVAVKVISRQTVTETSQLRHEVNVLRKISHRNIVRFRDLKKSAAHFYLVLEFCAGGDLSQYLSERGRAAEVKARRFLAQIAAGLCVLHRENVLHRDLKPQNILLSDCSDDPVLKIADFGFARALQPQDMAATVCGSPLYMAPEILRHEPYDARADLWSVGSILYELLLGRTPFSGANPMQLLKNIEQDDHLSFEGVDVTSEGQEFLRALLRRSPKERLSSKEFVSHAYVQIAGGAGRGVVARGVDEDLETCDWCVPADLDDDDEDAGPASPSSGPGSPSPAASPFTCRSPDFGSPRGGGSFHLSCEVAPGPGGADAAELSGASSPEALSASGADVRGRSPSTTVSPPSGGAEDEEYVVVATQRPATFARGRGPTPRAAASSFCGNLSRIAHALEHLASLRVGAPGSAPERLALLLRALGLLEKALGVSLAEEDAREPMRAAFQRILEAAESAGAQVRAAGRNLAAYSGEPPARPNAAIFDYAVQLAKEAAVTLSKGHEEGGWEAPVRDRLSLALLLLDLLGNEADGEDAAAIAAYSAPMSRLLAEIDLRLERSASPRGCAVEAAPAAARPPSALLGC